MTGANTDFFSHHSGEGFEKSVRTIADLGFDGVLIWISEEFLHGHQRQAKAVMDSTGLRIFQLHPPWPDIAASDPIKRKESLDLHRRWIDLAVALAAETVVIHPTGASCDEKDRGRLIELNVIGSRQLADHARGSNVMLALENNHPTPDGFHLPGCGAAELIQIIKSAGSAGMGICFDTSHAYASWIDPADFVRQAGDQIITTHLHDTTGRHDEHLLPGAGVIDWRSVLTALKGTSEDIPLVLEAKPKAESGAEIPFAQRKELLRQARLFLQAGGARSDHRSRRQK